MTLWTDINQIIKPGSANAEAIKAIQHALTAAGYPVNVNGVYPSYGDMEKTLTQFQIDNHLTPDGWAGEKTCNSLESRAAQHGAHSPAATLTPPSPVAPVAAGENLSDISGDGWRVARSLVKLRAQVNALFPNRSHESDGTIGDARHQAESSSDHNPHVRLGSLGIVTAMDITNDPAHGLSSEVLANALLATRDPRIKYVISNKKIASSVVSPWVWRPYNGVNPHDHHVHVSVMANEQLYDSMVPWDLHALGGVAPVAAVSQPAKPSAPQPVPPTAPKQEPAAAPMGTKQVYIAFLKGLELPLVETSPGIIAMAEYIASFGQNFHTKVFTWDDWRAARDWLKVAPVGAKKGAVGFSNGASEVTGITDEADLELDLVVSMDPTIWLSLSPLHGNVKEAICFHNVNPFSSFPPVGHASLSTAADFKGKLTIIDTWDSHEGVNVDPALQAVVYAKAKALA